MNEQIKKASSQKPERNFISGAEKKFRSVQYNLRSVNRNVMTKKDQEDIAYSINLINQYGFEFFPNHFVFDEINKLDALVNTLLEKENGRYVRT
jgi:hypothetical protein